MKHNCNWYHETVIGNIKIYMYFLEIIKEMMAPDKLKPEGNLEVTDKLIIYGFTKATGVGSRGVKGEESQVPRRCSQKITGEK